MRTSPRLGAFLMMVTIANLPLHADDVEPGIDPWITDCGDASDLLGLPAGFFGAHSDPLAQTVTLRGTPLPSLDGPPLGRIDTVVQRLDKADLECGASDVIRIQIVALRLEATTPLVVTYNGGHSPEQWDLEVCLSEEHSQSTTSMTIRQECPEGGTFSSTLRVKLKFVFRRQRDGDVIVWDPGEDHEIELSASGHWVHEPDQGLGVIRLAEGAVTDGDCDGVDDAELPGTSNFAPGVKAEPCACGQATGQVTQTIVPVVHEAPLHSHGVGPPTLDSAGAFRRDRPPREPRRPRVFQPAMLLVPLIAVFAGAIVRLGRHTNKPG
jgi:hypothetical protein